MKQYLLAHDLGTSGNKATLFSLEGKLIKSETSAYETYYSNGNWAEQDSEDWWSAVCSSTKKLLLGIDPKDIASVCFSGQMMGCLPVDKQGKPLHRHLLYCDQRSVEQENILLEKVGMEEVYRITGHRASASYGITKLRWLKDHHPEIFNQTWKMLNAKDYLNFRLTGRMVTDYNDASGTNAFDITRLEWSARILDAMGIPESMMPEAVPSTTVIGEIIGEASRATGLAVGTPVVAGAGDGGCATVGAGCVKPGRAYNYLGSSSWIATTSLKPVHDPAMQTFTWVHPVPGYLQPCGTMQTAGSSYDWMIRELARGESMQAETENKNIHLLLEDLMSQSSAGSKGVLFLPYMLGERSPRWNPDAKGSFLNLNLEIKRADMFRSVLEGVTMNLDIILKIFQKELPIENLLVIGGGAKGRFWNQLMADIFGIPVHIPINLEEATSMGAAIIGGVGCGALSGFDVVDRFIEMDRVLEPNSANRGVYDSSRILFEKAYWAVEPLFNDFNSLKAT
ncbi:FGGY-family carbohydrate kinase [Oceanispirochaeta sp.]|jgi:xylulokinase|uniref:xylulokinase n=1 Tax=Oceanispirochaeta sp. TaxID=2035350 RepID=UPI0026214865|nr:FGGY-family carbohydrate kinase [Oceanispirochaeta sp.]MDA3958739.1 FGGY-family carbohydrate kinase [Oceanispirochaeta sp.]